jgi:HAMP domain-containing protein
LFDDVAYAFIEDGRGEVIAHTLGNFPAELRRGPAGGGGRQVYRRQLTLQGQTVYETGVPVLEGRAGTVYVGIWAGAVENEIQSALLRLVGIIALVPIVGALLSFLLAYWIVRPIVGLTRIADKVTMGDLETSVMGNCVQSHDEIGDLARSLERMRSSLKAAMMRLGREMA